MHNSLHSSQSQSDLSDSKGSLNSSDSEGELCGVGAVCTLRNEYRGKMIIGHLNINSLAEKFVDIEDVLLNEPIELLCISETKLNESHLQDFCISQYRTYRRDRPPRLREKGAYGGGLITWARGSVPSRHRTDLESDNAETLYRTECEK